jgi:hypothetical protein
MGSSSEHRLWAIRNNSMMIRQCSRRATGLTPGLAMTVAEGRGIRRTESFGENAMSAPRAHSDGPTP